MDLNIYLMSVPGSHLRQLNHRQKHETAAAMDNLTDEERREIEQAAEILLSMMEQQFDQPQSIDNVLTTQSSLDDDVEMTDVAESMLLLSRTAVVFAQDPAPAILPSAPAQSVQSDVSVTPQPLKPQLPRSCCRCPVAAAPAPVPGLAPANNPQWAGLTAAQQAQQQVRHAMTPWQRAHYNYLPYGNRDRNGNTIGRLYLTATERRNLRQQQRRTGAALIRRGTTQGMTFPNRRSRN
ncbi:unnamed protein product [Aureobasidium pullulans]|nr:unnamed protein product [Aureobasidium pullulans]